jgi:hypothetical protein
VAAWAAENEAPNVASDDAENGLDALHARDMTGLSRARKGTRDATMIVAEEIN